MQATEGYSLYWTSSPCNLHLTLNANFVPIFIKEETEPWRNLES